MKTQLLITRAFFKRGISINIYPNPASGQITIEVKLPVNQGLLKIFSINGHELNHYQITETGMIIDIGYLPAGIYFVRFTCENEVRMLKVIKVPN
jgi:hypothetical protein